MICRELSSVHHNFQELPITHFTSHASPSAEIMHYLINHKITQNWRWVSSPAKFNIELDRCNVLH